VIRNALNFIIKQKRTIAVNKKFEPGIRAEFRAIPNLIKNIVFSSLYDVGKRSTREISLAAHRNAPAEIRKFSGSHRVVAPSRLVSRKKRGRLDAASTPFQTVI
jgi:hypothetical protein